MEIKKYEIIGLFWAPHKSNSLCSIRSLWVISCDCVLFCSFIYSGGVAELQGVLIVLFHVINPSPHRHKLLIITVKTSNLTVDEPLEYSLWNSLLLRMGEGGVARRNGNSPDFYSGGPRFELLLGAYSNWPRLSFAVSSAPQLNSRIVHPFGNHRFLSDPFQFILRQSPYWQRCKITHECQSRSHITTDRQSVSKSCCRAPFAAHDQIFITLWQLRSCFCGVCLLYMLLALVSVVFLGSESFGTRDHLLLSQISDFPFRCLLRLTMSRWRYSNPPPHGLNSWKKKTNIE
jgi:hypothetical protein